MKHVLLISNSTLYGSGYLDHAESEIRDFLGDAKRVLFVPYALYDRDAYATTARERFQKMGNELTSVHTATDPKKAFRKTDVLFIGGGNTFRLLRALYDFDLLPIIRDRVAEGMPYIGSSAGANVAGPTIKTTKDMPIVQPKSFDALGLVLSKLVLTFKTPIRIRPIWARPRNSEFCNSWKRTRRRSQDCERARWCELRTASQF